MHGTDCTTVTTQWRWDINIHPFSFLQTMHSLLLKAFIIDSSIYGVAAINGQHHNTPSFGKSSHIINQTGSSNFASHQDILPFNKNELGQQKQRK